MILHNQNTCRNNEKQDSLLSRYQRDLLPFSFHPSSTESAFAFLSLVAIYASQIINKIIKKERKQEEKKTKQNKNKNQAQKHFIIRV